MSQKEQFLLKLQHKLFQYDWGRKNGISLFFNKTLTGYREAELVFPNKFYNELHEGTGEYSTEYIVKFMSVARNLSLQLHPSRDSDHLKKKDEYLLALESFSMLLSFRSNEEIQKSYDHLSSQNKYSELIDLHLKYLNSDIEKTITELETLNVEKLSQELLEILYSGEYGVCNEVEDYHAYRFDIIRTIERYRTDSAVALIPLLAYRRLSPNDCIYVPAGTIHCYLSGIGIEVSSVSNDTLRYGLTEKDKDSEGFVREMIEEKDRSAQNPILPERIEYDDTLYTLSALHVKLADIDLRDSGSRSILGVESCVLICKSGKIQLKGAFGTISLSSGDAAAFRGYTSMVGSRRSSIVIIGHFLL